MPGKRVNPRRAKVNRNYTVAEVASLYGVHRQTVRNWLKAGLPSLAENRPILILGRALGEFLTARRQQAKQPCGVGQLYCLRCHAPRSPAGDMLDYVPITRAAGNLCGICSTCHALMFRRVRLLKVDAVKGKSTVAYPQGKQRLRDTPVPSLHCHFTTEAADHEKAQ